MYMLSLSLSFSLASTNARSRTHEAATSRERVFDLRPQPLSFARISKRRARCNFYGPAGTWKALYSPENLRYHNERVIYGNYRRRACAAVAKDFFSKTIINRVINEATIISERARARVNSIIINALCRASARSARAR